MEKALYPDFLKYPRLEYSLAHSEFIFKDIPLKDGDTMEVCIYDYKADCFTWIPVVFHCSHDYDESYYFFEGLPFGHCAVGLHVRKFHRQLN